MISIVYACMGREANLIESVKSWKDVSEITEIIIVDWSCQTKLIDYVDLQPQSNKIKIIRVNNQKFFHMSKSYNLAISYVTNKIVLKLDCDYQNINAKWIQHLKINKHNELDNYFIVGDHKFAPHYSGLVLMNTKDFVGYNENMTGWGYDDIDLYARIESIKKIQRISFFCIKDYIYHIPHNDYMRIQNFPIKDRTVSNMYNKKISNTQFAHSKYDTLLDQNDYIELIEK